MWTRAVIRAKNTEEALKVADACVKRRRRRNRINLHCAGCERTSFIVWLRNIKILGFIIGAGTVLDSEKLHESPFLPDAQ
jgi:2-keto-3-deoxy-6-phosphogluconate aldolase